MGHGSMNYQLKIARLIMIFINVILFLTGATLIGEGIELLLTRRFQKLIKFIPIIENSTIIKNKLFPDEILYIIMIIFGLILISLGFFGCSGAVTQIQCLLFLYSWIIGIILIFQTIIIISIIVFRSKLTEQLITSIHNLIRDIYQGPLEKYLQPTSILWDSIMYNLKCCGIENKNDFNITTKWNRTNPWWNNSMTIEHKNFKYPLTCCPMNNISIKNSTTLNKLISCAINGTDIYEISCYRKLIDIFYSFKIIILISISLIIIIEMFVLIFILIIYNRNQMRRIFNNIENLPPPYSSRTRINNANLYVHI